MAKHRRMHVLNTMKSLGMVPLFYYPDSEVASRLMIACAEGGCPIVEFTNRGDRALEIFRKLAELRDEKYPDVILGVGSVCNGATAAMFMQAGADFIVAPLLDEETARVCNSEKVPYLPGCGSVTEIHRAHLLGVEICKIFPAGQVGGPSFIQAVRGPCPWADLLPSGGVSPDRENLEAWFKAGAACVGMGSNLISKEIIKTQNYAQLKERIENVLQLIREIRSTL